MSQHTSHKGIYVFSVLVIAGAAFWMLVHMCKLPRKRAARAIQISSSLVVGKSDFDQVKKVAEEIGAKSEGECTRSHCVLIVVIENSRLLRWSEQSATSFREYFLVDAGKLAVRSSVYQAGIGPASSVVSIEEMVQPAKGESGPLKVYARGDPGGIVTSINVHLTADANPDVRAKYLAFNLSCLSKFGGCDSAEELLPGWK